MAMLAESDNPVSDLQRTIGNQATAAFLQRQNEGQGSVTVVGSAAETEGALDKESFTKGVTGERSADETPSEKEFMDALEKKAGEIHTDFKKHVQHPSIAQIGIRPENIGDHKLAVYIGNNNYKNNPPDGPFPVLPGAKADAERMKATMEGHGYASVSLQEDVNASFLDSIFNIGVRQAKAYDADAIMLYYAGHGLPEGLVGVESNYKEKKAENTEGKKAEGGGRGGKVTGGPITLDGGGPQFTDIEPYSKVMKHLGASVGYGVHTSLIVDACHSGTATDLVRTKAVERFSSVENRKVKAISDQIKRLEEMKTFASSGIEKMIAELREKYPQASEPEETGGEQSDADTRKFKKTKKPARLSTDIHVKFWEKVVRPELEQVAVYLKGAGMEVEIPSDLNSYSPEDIAQQINLVINKLIDLVEQLKREAEESTLEKAGG
jgi:hypothetical protein